MADSPNIDEMRATLARVSIYRKVCDGVRASSGQSMFGGLLYIGIGLYFYSAWGKFTPIIVAFMSLGVGELIVGLWKRVAPSPECILMDAILEFAFVLYLVFRQTDGFAQIPKQQDPIFIFIALWALYRGVRDLQHYFQLKRIFVERPTTEHVAYVDDLTAEVAEGYPASDPTALDLPTKPRLKAKLMGDVAFLLDMKAGELFLCARRELDIARETRGTQLYGTLTILREEYAPFPLDAATWNNYANWKAAGGEAPSPVTIR